MPKKDKAPAPPTPEKPPLTVEERMTRLENAIFAIREQLDPDGEPARMETADDDTFDVAEMRRMILKKGRRLTSFLLKAAAHGKGKFGNAEVQTLDLEKRIDLARDLLKLAAAPQKPGSGDKSLPDMTKVEALKKLQGEFPNLVSAEMVAAAAQAEDSANQGATPLGPSSLEPEADGYEQW